MTPNHAPCFATSPDEGRLCQRPQGHDGDHKTSGPGYSATWADGEGSRSSAEGWTMEEILAPPHECRPIADFSNRMTGRRELWVGEIIEAPAEFDWEAYCIHIVSGIKPEFVWCVNAPDLHYLTALIDATGQLAVERWREPIVEMAKERAQDRGAQ